MTWVAFAKVRDIEPEDVAKLKILSDEDGGGIYEQLTPDTYVPIKTELNELQIIPEYMQPVTETVVYVYMDQIRIQTPHDFYKCGSKEVTKGISGFKNGHILYLDVPAE